MDPAETVKPRLTALVILTGMIWALSLANLYFFQDRLLPLLIPRTGAGLLGVPCMPFIHKDLNHLLCNTLPLLVFAWLILNRGVAYFSKVTLFIVLFGGLLVWALARGNPHIGASGLVFGYFGFLVARGLYDKSVRSVIVALAVIIFYGGIVWGVLPVSRFVSWEAHLFGLLAGIAAARVLRHKTRQALI